MNDKEFTQKRAELFRMLNEARALAASLAEAEYNRSNVAYGFACDEINLYCNRLGGNKKRYDRFNEISDESARNAAHLSFIDSKLEKSLRDLEIADRSSCYTQKEINDETSGKCSAL